ncbi:hypothetical protein V8C26DRAFT_345446 [Trichoderma gracile]
MTLLWPFIFASPRESFHHQLVARPAAHPSFSSSSSSSSSSYHLGYLILSHLKRGDHNTSISRYLAPSITTQNPYNHHRHLIFPRHGRKASPAASAQHHGLTPPHPRPRPTIRRRPSHDHLPALEQRRRRALSGPRDSRHRRPDSRRNQPQRPCPSRGAHHQQMPRHQGMQHKTRYILYCCRLTTSLGRSSHPDPACHAADPRQGRL